MGLRMAGERELMAQAVQGDRAAFGTVFGRHAERLARMAFLLLHDAASVEDAVQETFMRGLNYQHTYKPDADPGAWFYTICLNVCRKMLRDRKEREGRADTTTLEGGRAHHGSPYRGVITSVVRRETQGKLALALGFLTRAQREAFVLHYIQGLPYETVSDILKVSPGAARALSHRAKAVLREKLPRNAQPTAK